MLRSSVLPFVLPLVLALACRGTAFSAKSCPREHADPRNQTGSQLHDGCFQAGPGVEIGTGKTNARWTIPGRLPEPPKFHPGRSTNEYPKCSTSRNKPKNDSKAQRSAPVYGWDCPLFTFTAGSDCGQSARLDPFRPTFRALPFGRRTLPRRRGVAAS